MSNTKRIPARWKAAAAILLTLTVTGCTAFAGRGGGAGTAAAPRAGEVTTITAVSSVAASGPIAARQSTSVYWKTTGTVATVNVQAGDTVKAGDALMALDPASLPQNVILARADLIAAQNALDDLLHPSALAVANAQKAVADAQDALDKAKSDLRSIQNPAGQSLYDAVADTQLALQTAQSNQQLANVSPDQQALASAKVATDQTFRNYQDLQAKYAASNDDPFLYNAVQQAQAAHQAALGQQQTLELRIASDAANKADAVKKAQAKHATAVANLNEALAGPDADKLAVAQAKVAVAEAALADAQSKQSQLTSPDPNDVAAAEARVRAAQATLDSATLKAPFDGEVLAVNYQPGDSVAQALAALVLADRRQLHVEAAVDESEVGQIQVGNAVTVTLDALPGVTLAGSVAWIRPYGETVQGLVKYTVRVEVNEGDPRLLLGMTANTEIVTAVSAGALAVPLDAVQLDGQGEFVSRLRSDGTPERVNVTSGLTQGDLVVVTGDLQPGDQVQLVTPKPATTVGGPFGGG